MTSNPPRYEPEPFDPNNFKTNYILKYRKPVLCPNLNKWGQWFERNHHKRIVRRSYIGDMQVSTVFICIDHRVSREGDPILFETMLGNSEGILDDYQTRCCTWREALAMHKEAIKWIKNGN